MNRQLVRSFLEAFAVGDAYGKATEYCSKEEIERCFDSITTILTPEESPAHKDLEWGQVTDDSEQNIWLIRKYAESGRVDAYETAMSLIDWMDNTDSAKYIGPSSQYALTFIKNGGDIEKAGIHGTTCGGMMRTPSAFLFSTEETLERNVVECLKPTHNTSIAMEAAMAYAYALQEALDDKCTVDSILNCACTGAALGKKHGDSFRMNGVGPSVAARIAFLRREVKGISNNDLKSLLYDVLGTTLSSADVASAVFALFIHCKDDACLAIRLATECGGDSDTIASLAAGLCTLYAKRHNIEKELVELVSKANRIEFDSLAELITTRRKDR